MKVTINQDNCISCGVCSGDCPEVFEEDDSGVTQIVEAYRVDGDPAVGDVPDDLMDCVQAAIDSCPEECIQIA
jgi:ferredoxin